MTSHPHHPSIRRLAVVAITSLALLGGVVGGQVISTTTAAAAPVELTNTAHLDFLLDDVTPPQTSEHSTYRQAAQPTLVMPWTYADSRPGGNFARVGGGPLDVPTGHYGQGAFNADDVARAAVVYLRHWQQTGDSASRTHAYELLRSITYLQTATGPNRGNVVLWIQSDGTLNRSPEPKELPDPSDSGPSYWLARTIWALGEGYAAFADDDPAFASFLQTRLQLSVAAVDRQVLTRYGRYTVSDGQKVPAWLIVDGADISAEATLGLSAYVTAAPYDRTARRALRQLLVGVDKMSTDPTGWPYGAILPWAESPSIWHAWSSQMAGALARGSVALNDHSLLSSAVTESVSFDPTLITADGPDNGWSPTPVETVQIAYGVDSRVQNLLATADATGRPGLRTLAAMNASWFFGANRSGTAMYDPATGVTFDGLQTDGTFNPNSGAESTIHGLLTMLALDAHPTVRAQATDWQSAPVRTGLTAVEAETASPTTGEVITRKDAWTGESAYGGAAFLRLSRDDTATIDLGPATQARRVEPVLWLPKNGSGRSRWSAGPGRTTTLASRVGTQGISAEPGALLPLKLSSAVPASRQTLAVRATRSHVDVDAVLIRPLISRAVFGQGDASTELITSIDRSRRTVSPTSSSAEAATRYDARGRVVGRTILEANDRVSVEPGGFTLVTTPSACGGSEARC